jgi:hypothetical protein
MQSASFQILSLVRLPIPPLSRRSMPGGLTPSSFKNTGLADPAPVFYLPGRTAVLRGRERRLQWPRIPVSGKPGFHSMMVALPHFVFANKKYSSRGRDSQNLPNSALNRFAKQVTED